MVALLEFPCDFDFKVFGYNTETFEKAALSIVAETFPNLKENAIRYKRSKNDKYLSITISVRAENQMELDTVYQAFTACEHVLMSL